MSAQVRFPSIFERVTSAFGLFGMAIFDVGSFDCFFRFSYFEKLVFVTVTPFGVVGLGASLYWSMHHIRGNLTTSERRKDVFSKLIYGILLFIYVVLPSITTYVITYFSCAHYDRGDGRSDLLVVATELSIECTSTRYRQWKIYDVLMIVIWPVGMTLGLSVLLFSHRAKLNPKLEEDERLPPQRRSSDIDFDGFARQKSRHKKAMEQLQKLEIRDTDDSIAGLEFLFEEYEPRCYLFPIFEIARRLFLSSVLAVFYPGSTQQLVVGLLGAMLSYVVYQCFEAFIEDDDDVVAGVASGEVVLLYFAALATYTADEADQKQNVFSGVAFGVLLVLVFFASFFVAVYIILLESLGHETMKEAYKHAKKTPRAISASISRGWSRMSSRRRFPNEMKPTSVDDASVDDFLEDDDDLGHENPATNKIITKKNNNGEDNDVEVLADQDSIIIDLPPKHKEVPDHQPQQ